MGPGPGLLTALASALAYDYFYIPPVPSLAISGRRNVVTLITFVISAGLSGLVARMAARLRVAEENRRQAAQVRARVLAAADEERRRVVRDMHDGAQQRLVHAMITLQLAGDALRRDDRGAAALRSRSTSTSGRAGTPAPSSRPPTSSSRRLDGELDVGDVPGGGTRIVATLPLGDQPSDRRR